MPARISNHIRKHRIRAGLSQHELAVVLGYKNQAAVSRHERFQSIPTLLTALGYEVIFHVPAAKMFSGLREQVEQGIVARLSELEAALKQGRSTKDGVRKLDWIAARRTGPTD